MDAKESEREKKEGEREKKRKRERERMERGGMMSQHCIYVSEQTLQNCKFYCKFVSEFISKLTI